MPIRQGYLTSYNSHIGIDIIRMKKITTNLNENLKRLREIVSWFESQSELDVEKGLELVKEGAELVRQSRERLGQIENEFKEIKNNKQEK